MVILQGMKCSNYKNIMTPIPSKYNTLPGNQGDREKNLKENPGYRLDTLGNTALNDAQ
jgi:hypothetical protein